MSAAHKHSKKPRSRNELSLNKTHSTAKDKFGEVITSLPQNEIDFASEVNSASELLKYKLYVKKDPPPPVLSDSIFTPEIKSPAVRPKRPTPIPSLHDQGLTSSDKYPTQSEKLPEKPVQEVKSPQKTSTDTELRVNNLENRISALESHMIDLGKEMDKILERQSSTIKAISSLSNEIRDIKNLIAR